jgi:hypothetical protein
MYGGVYVLCCLDLTLLWTIDTVAGCLFVSAVCNVLEASSRADAVHVQYYTTVLSFIEIYGLSSGVPSSHRGDKYSTVSMGQLLVVSCRGSTGYSIPVVELPDPSAANETRAMTHSDTVRTVHQDVST